MNPQPRSSFEWFKLVFDKDVASMYPHDDHYE